MAAQPKTKEREARIYETQLRQWMQLRGDTVSVYRQPDRWVGFSEGEIRAQLTKQSNAAERLYKEFFSMIKFLLLLLFPCVVHAQFVPHCLPQPSPAFAGWVGTSLEGAMTAQGAWVGYQCVLTTPTFITTQTVVYVGLLPELSKVGARMATIAKAKDPLKSLQTAGSRFTILPLTDPSLAAIVLALPPKYAQASAPQ